MVDGLVAQSGGTMRITSRPGRGTLVELFLPVSDEIDAEWPVPAEPVRIRAARSYRILVVDDDPAVATGTVAMLDDLGHCAIESGSAEEALRLLEADPGIEIVITDHAMPGMTGTELAGARAPDVAQPADCDCHRIRGTAPRLLDRAAAPA